MATALVTGGAGFIGSHLVERLMAEGREVRVLDDLSTGLASNLELPGGQPELVQGSILDPYVVAQAVQGVEVVYHLGALASVARSVENPPASHAACATGTLNVLDAARKAGVRRVVYAGSSSAYGGVSGAGGQTEDIVPCALSPYAAAKLAGEYYCQAFAASFGLETVRVRFFNIFGPRQRADSPYSGVIAIFARLMKRDERPTVHGDGLQSRDFTYVANAVQALRLAADTPGVSGRVYNVGTGRSVSVLDLIGSLNTLMGKSLEPLHAESRTGDVKYSLADISRISTELGYRPDVGFEDGLAKTLAWYDEGR